MTQPRLLLVEDEAAIVRPLVAGLGREGFRVQAFSSAEAALAAMDDARPDLVVLDIMLPGMSGLDACRVIRSNWPVLILMLTARGEPEDRLLGLEIGADDYLPKPFSIRELVARIRALLRRARWREQEDPELVVGNLRIDRDRRQVTVGGAPVHLTPREFDLLVFLAERAPQVVNRGDIMRAVWDPLWEGTTATLDVHIAHLRRKLEADPHRPRYIETIRGVGYRVSGGLDDAARGA